MDPSILREYAFKLVGTRYEFGGKTPLDGIDCSGVVCELLKSAGILGNMEDLNAQGLYDRCINSVKTYRLEEPRLGALCFYGQGSEKVTHVVFCINETCAIGADGGGKDTLTIQDAIRDRAFVKLRPINNPSYRTDVVAIILPNY